MSRMALASESGQAPTPRVPVERSVRLLPVLEQGDAWLATLANETLVRMERRGFHLLPTVRAGEGCPLVVPPDECVVVVPFGSPAHRIGGTSYVQRFGLDAWLLEQVPQRMTRPEPAAWEVAPFSVQGGWSGTSQAGIKAQVLACPGWEREITLAGPMAVLRSPDGLVDPQPQHLLQWMPLAFRGTLSTDAHTYVGYLAHVLVRTCAAIALHHGMAWRQGI